ncbi:ImmA/IrrE family metallo-endopeptidase [Bacillus subtilis]|uniref:ImmA/IrrE family metallo-endopeptidase n=1 Tax=Bacillus subtilis TaxID=1423 RepID=UPI000FF8C970|nr:ImmA/IrrE family metallo-endopeptidase [Bacillus subtilis]MBU8594093.1 ImmA/IrrE family metallo-endopeptidase [Bacillus subtilis]MDP8527082.1 ImmA/IrrE family metallo-endopeptidase [Bacillus subtilis]MEC2338631.1 ImmA/IrrE family metallo-endopeptidase [Bacillus subtilis]QAR95771.1 ImmA/IrrE family metallo-endopeptidase [Bacillus subtilis]
MKIHSPIYKDNKYYQIAKDRSVVTRKKFGIEDGPITGPIFQFLEKMDCFVVTFDLGRTAATGMYLRKKAENDVKLVLIHNKRVKGQQNFTAAHELSHVLFDKDELIDICYPDNIKTRDEKEILADHFAAHFLMPEESIINDCQGLDNITKLDIIKLCVKYKVSFQSMALRLYILGLIAKEEYEYYQNQSKKGKLRLRAVCEEHGLDNSTFCVPEEAYISEEFFNLLYKSYHKANISRSVLIKHYLKPLEEALKLDIEKYIKIADENYPDELGWDEI